MDHRLRVAGILRGRGNLLVNEAASKLTMNATVNPYHPQKSAGAPASAQIRNRFTRQRIRAFVELVTGVTADPMPVDLVRAECGVETLPQIDILDRLFV